MPLNTLGDVAVMASRLPGELQKAERRGVQRAAAYVTRGIRGEIKGATGGDSRLSGFGRRGARVGARYDPVSEGSNPSTTIRPTGPLWIIENRTRPHEITPRKRRGKKAALKFKDGTIRRSAHHPGTRAKRPWAKGVAKTRDMTGKIFDKEIQNAIVRVLT